jgi:hypothetical protein
MASNRKPEQQARKHIAAMRVSIAWAVQSVKTMCGWVARGPVDENQAAMQRADQICPVECMVMWVIPGMKASGSYHGNEAPSGYAPRSIHNEHLV